MNKRVIKYRAWDKAEKIWLNPLDLRNLIQMLQADFKVVGNIYEH